MKAIPVQKNAYTIELEGFVAEFYEKIARGAGLPVERVLADALLKTAGELVCRAREARG